MVVDALQVVQHDHSYVRQSLTLVRAAFSCHHTPPDGHAYWRILGDAAAYLAGELPRHIAFEEANVFPAFAGRPGDAGLEALRAEHREIIRLAQELWALTSLPAPDRPGDRWSQARACAMRLEAVLSRHMEAEVALLRELGHGALMPVGRTGEGREETP